MANLSPAVITTEFALDLSVEQAGSATGATVGIYEWGPVNSPVLVNNSKTLAQIFGMPSDKAFLDWFSAYNFLEYTNRLYVNRVVPDGTGDSTTAGNSVASVADTGVGTAVTANDGGESAVFIENEDDFESQLTTLETTTDNVFIAKYPGVYGNKLSISMVDSTNYTSWAYKDAFDSIPAADEVFAVVLLDGAIAEQFVGQQNKDATSPSGGSAYLEEVINRTSSYINVVGDNIFYTVDPTTYAASSADDAIFRPINITTALTLGTDGDFSTAEDAARIEGWGLFINIEDWEIDLPFAGGASPLVGQYLIESVAEVRKDCVAFVSPRFEDVVGIKNRSTIVTNIVGTRQTFGSSSYGAMDGNYKRQYDQFNDKYRWIPLNGDIAGLHARTDFERDAWWAAAGFTRGRIKGVSRLAFSPEKAFRDELYKNGINPAYTAKGDGPVFFGNKTLLTSTSSFSRINVRRLFNVLKRSIARFARFQLFEFNDRFTQNAFKQAVNPFLRRVQARRGVQDFLVVADDSNNTPEVIDAFEFVGDIYIKPAKAIETIRLNFINVKTGVDFEEVELNPTEGL